MDTARIRELPASERPREKATAHGTHALSDSELLAIFIRTGMPGKNAIAIAQELLRACGGLVGISRRSPQEIAKAVKGIGAAKAIELAAAFEIGKRLLRNQDEAPLMDTPERIYSVLGQQFAAMRSESLQVALLDTKLRLMRLEEISHGSLNECVAHPREILLPAITHSAYAFVLVHNHPSGNPEPSEADRRVTANLREAAGIMQIRFLDHIIFGTVLDGKNPYFSFREAGYL